MRLFKNTYIGCFVDQLLKSLLELNHENGVKHGFMYFQAKN